MHYPITQKVCALSGIVVIVLFGLAFWPTSMFLPPPAPTLTPIEVAALYQHNTVGIRIGMLMMSLGGAFMGPLVAVIAIQMKRIEGATPILAYTQMTTGTIGALFFIIPALIFSAAAYHPERAPELTALLHELGWFFLVMPVGPAFLQNFAIGFAILKDKSVHPVFPRWLGFFNFWVALLFVAGGLITFFKTGPFAWNGLLAFWVALVVFGAWFFVMVVMLLKAIDGQTKGGASASYNSTSGSIKKTQEERV